MNDVNKTLYIPLYGKSYVSKKGIILQDKKAEEIWDAEGFALKGKAASKWLAYYMGMRAAVFDRWVEEKLAEDPEAVVIHLGCGMDSRAVRVKTAGHKWYDVDFPEVMDERRRYFEETESYRMISGDAREKGWLSNISESNAIIVMEGISMYLTPEELRSLMEALEAQFKQLAVLMDCYTVFAAKMSKYKNPINEVGVTQVYGMDDPKQLENAQIAFVKEHEMTPDDLIGELKGMEKRIFKKLYAGNFSKKLYRMYEYKTK